jgi:formate/nitrite transporter FocA (FNT family)
VERIKKYTLCFLSAMLAGLMIGVGGTVYLSVDNPVVGSLLFAVGLFSILVFQMNLFTGKVGYLINNKPKYIIDLIVIWFGNLLGEDLYCNALYYIRPDLATKATTLCNSKLTQTLPSTLFLGVMCGLLMYIAVDNFKNNNSDIGKYIGIFVCVSVFILCKFEHCIADMFYFSMMNGLSITSFTAMKYIIIVTIGNSIGAILIPLTDKIIRSLNN